ncbi:19745_t:CDS:2 [Funneliformis geosporum]|uniref:19745_t:CDS:1 n=1 Tax=Funneliformis geosporum TaxID=1117311 RepID=A0A9W4WQ90_9GLOM|nr:19745_t:CDS:2 [Funneliformis geosporum]
MHTPGYSKFNSVERSIATLSDKLEGITLPINYFGMHLNTQGKVINPEFALQNFRYVKKNTDGRLMEQIGHLGHIKDIVRTYSWNI